MLDGELTAALAALQYIRGGSRFRDFFSLIALMMASAVSRPPLPG